jgi:flotillin
LQAGADAKRVKLEAEATATRTQQIGEAEAAATRARGMAEGDAVKATGLAEAEAIKARAEALAQNQDAVIGQQIAEQLPAIVGEAAKAFGSIGQLTVLNGAEGVGQMFSQVLGMGAAAIPLLRNVIEQTGATNGASRGTGGSTAPASEEKPAPGAKRRS